MFVLYGANSLVFGRLGYVGRDLQEDSVTMWPTRRRVAVGLWLGAMVTYVGMVGIPFDRATQLLMLISAAVAFSVGTPARTTRVFADWIPFAALLYGYDYSRGAADRLGIAIHVTPVFITERTLFGWLCGGKIPSVCLQQHLYVPSHAQWWEALVTIVYCSHFVAPWVILGVLYVRNRVEWGRFARRLLTVSMAALVTYCAYPAAPPWFAAKIGLSDPLLRISTRGFQVLHLPIAGEWLSLGQGVVNKFAAVPSLHAGMTVTIAAYFWPRASRRLRSFLVVYVLGMAFALVYSGEHYVIDALLGWGYAIAVEAGVRAWERRRDVLTEPTEHAVAPAEQAVASV